MNKYLSSNVRMVLIVVGALCAVASMIFVPAFLVAAVIISTILGFVVMAAFTYDWALRGDEDIAAAREAQDRRHARIG